MKAMTKSELAERAGVGLNTLSRWMKPMLPELEAMGMLPNSRLLPPRVVKYIAERYCIDVEEAPPGGRELTMDT